MVKIRIVFSINSYNKTNQMH